jgi:hypothetical protein
MKESPLMRQIQLAAARIGVHLFRNNVGNGYVGEIVRVLPNGDVVLRRWRRIQFGLAPGSSDLIGWRTATITHDMVGHERAQFIACETKTTRGVITEEQTAFVTAVHSAGGLALVPRSVDEALAALTK